MSEDVNESRRLAPDTRWILTFVATAAVAIVSINQWQISSAMALTLERARANTVSRSDLDMSFRPRDELIKQLANDIIVLREGRATVTQSMQATDSALQRVIEVAMATKAQASSTEGQLMQLLKQADSNAKLMERLANAQSATSAALSERLTRLESQAAQGPSGRP